MPPAESASDDAANLGTARARGSGQGAPAGSNGATTDRRPLRRALAIAAWTTTIGWILVVILWPDGAFAFTFDDAYYYVAIARNIVAGHGSTFDQINATNGYHPLWMALCTIPFAFGLDGLDAMRALLVFQLVAGWGASLLLVAQIASREIGAWKLDSRDADPARASRVASLRKGATITLAAVFLLLTANPFVVKAFVNGLESGIAVTIYALILSVATSPGPGQLRASDSRANTAGGWLARPVRWRLGMGILLAIAFLARTDAIILVGCTALWCLGDLATARARHGAKGSGDQQTSTRSAVPLVALFGPAAVTIAVYLAFNQANFGTPVQVSGLVKRAPLDATTIALFAGFLVVAGAIGRHTFRRARGTKARRTPRFPHAGGFAINTGWFAAFSVLLIGYYNVLQTQQWLWYYCPALLYLVILMTLAVADIIDVALAGAGNNRSPVRILTPVIAVFVVPLLLGFVVQAGSFADPNLLSIQTANRDAGEWINHNVGLDAVLASWDAGAVGYFADRRVVNIDGVVNSLDYYDAMLHGTVPRFLRCEHLGYVVNHGVSVNGRDPDIDKLIKAVYGEEAARESTVIHRVPFIYSGSANNGGGIDAGGTGELAVHVYEIPTARRGPRPDDQCP